MSLDPRFFFCRVREWRNWMNVKLRGSCVIFVRIFHLHNASPLF